MRMQTKKTHQKQFIDFWNKVTNFFFFFFGQYHRPKQETVLLQISMRLLSMCGDVQAPDCLSEWRIGFLFFLPISDLHTRVWPRSWIHPDWKTFLLYRSNFQDPRIKILIQIQTLIWKEEQQTKNRAKKKEWNPKHLRKFLEFVATHGHIHSPRFQLIDVLYSCSMTRCGQPSHTTFSRLD